MSDATASYLAGYVALLSILGPLYGVFFCLFSWSTYLSLKRHSHVNASSGSGNKPVWTTVPFIGSCLLFLSITPLWMLNVYESFAAFVYFDDGKEPALYYPQVVPAGMAVTILNQIVPAIGDWVMIYRLYVLWNRSKPIIVLPSLAWIGIIVCDIIIDVVLERASGGGFLSSATSELKRLIPAICTMTVFTNVYSSALISWKLYRHMPTEAYKTGGARITDILAIFIESAALYVVFMLIYIGVYASGAIWEVVFGEMMVPITGIAFTLINVRVNLGFMWQREESSRSVSGWRANRTGSFAESATIIHIQRDVELDSLDLQRRKDGLRRRD